MSKPKNWVTPQLKAAVLSKLFPGAGQIYNRQYVKGGVFIAATLLCLVSGVFFLARGFYQFYKSITDLADPAAGGVVDPMGSLGPGVLLLFACIAIWVLSIMDAWKTARRAPEPPAEEPARELVLPPPPP